MTEETGFPDEPTFNLAALAGQEQVEQRLFAAQNALVRRDAEIARLTERAERAEASRDEECERVMRWALIFAEIRDFAEALPARIAAIDADAMPAALRHPSVHLAATDERLTGVLQHELRAILGRHGPGKPGHLNPCTRCNGSGSEPVPDPDEAAGLVLVGRKDVKWVLAAIACYMPLDLADDQQLAVLGRLRDAAGAGQ